MGNYIMDVALAEVLSDEYCVRCDSTLGADEDRPDFCTVCWDHRRRLPRKIRVLLESFRLLLEQLPASEASRRERS